MVDIHVMIRQHRSFSFTGDYFASSHWDRYWALIVSSWAEKLTTFYDKHLRRSCTLLPSEIKLYQSETLVNCVLECRGKDLPLLFHFVKNTVHVTALFNGWLLKKYGIFSSAQNFCVMKVTVITGLEA